MDLRAMRSWVYTLYPVVAPILLFLFFILTRLRKKSGLPPGPPGWPIVGNLLQVGKSPCESLLGLAREYGPLMTLQLGMKTAVVVSSAAAAQEIFKTNDQHFAGRTVVQAAKCLSYHESSIVWGQYGPRWRMLRRMATTELFSAKRLNALQHLRRAQVLQTIRWIYEDSLKGKAVNVGYTAFLTSLNLLGNMIFTRNIFGPESEGAEEVKATITKLLDLGGTPNLADFFPFLQLVDPQGICREAKANMKRLFGWFDKFIEDRLSYRGASHKDFLDVLLERRSDGDRQGVGLTRADMLVFINDLFAAGSDTTATTIEWAMAELMRSPRVMKKAQEELDEVVGRDRKVEESDVGHLPYLQAVVKEVLRLHPAVPLMIPHRADNTCEVAGFVIREGTQVIVNAFAIGRDASIWDEPLEFVPERFVGSEIEFKGNNMELIPFGAGRRMCPGLPLANRMVHYVTASLLHSFDWSLPCDQIPQQMDMTAKPGLTLQKAVPLMALPTPRLPACLY